jgi:hypothetical protein
MNIRLKTETAQAEIIQHPARVKVAVCGRRWGKTVMMALALAYTAAQYAGSRSWYVANDYALCMAQKRMMARSPDFMKFVSHEYSQFPPRFEMKNGSEIAFRSADRPDLLLGAGLQLICHDEASRASKDLFWRVLMPMVADTRGTVLAGSTYNGRNWFYDLAEEGKKWNPDPDSPDNLIKTWIYPSHTGKAFQGEEGLKSLTQLKSKTDPMVWRQEFECEPLATIDAVFRTVDQCIGGTPESYNGDPYVLAHDIGRIEDAGAIAVLNLRTGLVAHCLEYPLGMPHEEQARRSRKTADDYHALVLLDTTGGGSGGRGESHVREYLKYLPNAREITFSPDTKRAMVGRLNLDFEQKKIRIPEAHKEMISQCKLYRYKLSEQAIIPTYWGKPDNLVAALMMCTWAREKKWTNGSGMGAVRGMFS